MKFTDIVDRVHQRMKEKAPNAKCSLCGQSSFSFAPVFMVFSAQEMYPVWFQEYSNLKAMPSAAMICNTCGNTYFINLLQLGFGDLLKPESLFPKD